MVMRSKTAVYITTVSAATLTTEFLSCYCCKKVDNSIINIKKRQFLSNRPAA